MTPQDIEYIVLHTAAYDGEEDTLEDIIRWHRARGFKTIGYHYYIKKDGKVKKGREDNRQGAHCIANNMNEKSLGICFEGHHDIEEWTPKQKSAFYNLSVKLIKKYYIDVEKIIGHREAYELVPVPKTCPGKKIDMQKVRRRIKRVYANTGIVYADLESLCSGKVKISHGMVVM